MAEIVPNGKPEKRPRTRCTAQTKLGQLCRATAIENGLCAIHSGRVNAKEIGKKGGRARAKGRRGSFRAAVAGLLERDPDRYAAELLNSGAAGFELASDLLEKEEERAKAEERVTQDLSHLTRSVSFEDVTEVLRKTEQIHLLADSFPRAIVMPMLEFLTASGSRSCLVGWVAWRGRRPRRQTSLRTLHIGNPMRIRRCVRTKPTLGKL